MSEKFEIKFWDQVNRRSGVRKEVNQRVQRMVEDTGADSYQKELLCREAVFVSVVLETMRSKAAESGELDMGVYTQMVNCLSGLLNKLGLTRQDIFDDGTMTLDEIVGGER